MGIFQKDDKINGLVVIEVSTLGLQPRRDGSLPSGSTIFLKGVIYMKAILEFNLDEPEDKRKFDIANKAEDMQIALWDIAQEIFRPARKHGYPDAEIQDLLTKCGGAGEDLIGKLEDKFYAILNEREVKTSS